MELRHLRYFLAVSEALNFTNGRSPETPNFRHRFRSNQTNSEYQLFLLRQFSDMGDREQYRTKIRCLLFAESCLKPIS
jgi:hypothetical protein